MLPVPRIPAHTTGFTPGLLTADATLILRDRAMHRKHFEPHQRAAIAAGLEFECKQQILNELYLPVRKQAAELAYIILSLYRRKKLTEKAFLQLELQLRPLLEAGILDPPEGFERLHPIIRLKDMKRKRAPKQVKGGPKLQS